MISKVLRYASPCAVMRPSRVLPPVEYCFGVRPNQAANWRPFLNSCPSATLATMAEALIGPTPLNFWMRLARSSRRACC